MSEGAMVRWLGEGYERGEVAFADYDRARTALTNGRLEVVRDIYRLYRPLYQEPRP